MKDIEELIRNHPFFEGLRPDYLTLIAGCGKNVRFNPGEFIFREQDTADQFYLVRYGKISLGVYLPERGKVAIVAP